MNKKEIMKLVEIAMDKGNGILLIMPSRLDGDIEILEEENG